MSARIASRSWSLAAAIISSPAAGAAALYLSLPLLGSAEVEKFVGFSDGKGGTENNISSGPTMAWIAFCFFGVGA